MAERRVPEVVRQAQCLRQILVQAERPGHRSPDLRDLEAVGEANPVVVAVGSDEHLRLVAQSPESDGVDDPVAVALEQVPRSTRPVVIFRMRAAPRPRRLRG
jgi:hypothetical protein